MEDLAALVLVATLKGAMQPKVQVLQKSNITTSELETIVKIAITAKEKVENLSDMCQIISIVLNSQHSSYNWSCIASEDAGMVGYVTSCQGFLKFKYGPYTYIISATKK